MSQSNQTHSIDGYNFQPQPPPQQQHQPPPIDLDIIINDLTSDRSLYPSSTSSNLHHYSSLLTNFSSNQTNYPHQHYYEIQPLTTTTSNHSRTEPQTNPKIEVDAIRKALSALPHDTQQNLLMVLLSTQSSTQQFQSQPQSQPHLSQLDTNFRNTSDFQSSSNQDWNLSHQTSTVSQPSTPIRTGIQQNSFHLPRDPPNLMTPLVSPNDMSSLSTFSNSSYQANFLSDPNSISSQSSYPTTSASSVELFSPLTSPALRPEVYFDQQSSSSSKNLNHHHHHHNIPTLINQAAALGLSNHQSSFQGSDQLLSSIHHDPLNGFGIGGPPPRPSHQPGGPNSFTNHQINQTASICSGVQTVIDTNLPSPHLVPSAPNMSPAFPSSSPSTMMRPTARQKTSRGTNKNRSNNPPPRSKSKSTSIDTEITNRSKRAKSVTSSIPLANSPIINPKQHSMSLNNTPLCFGNLNTLSQIGGQHPVDSPSPVDLMSTEVDQVSDRIESGTSRTLIPPLPPTVIATPTSLNQSIVTGHQRRLQPLTPAGIMNLGTTSSPKRVWQDSRLENLELEPHLSKVSTLGRVDGRDSNWTQTRTGIEILNRSGSDQVAKPLPSSGETIVGQVGCHESHTADTRTGSVTKSDDPSTIENPTTKPPSKDKVTKPTTSAPKPKARPKSEDKRNNKKVVQPITTEHSTVEQGTDTRKSSHKVAEQRRRDSLKMCFEDLRQILPPIHWTEDDDLDRRPGEGNVGGQRTLTTFDPSQPNRGISKVALLRRSNQYIQTLKERLSRRDELIEIVIRRSGESLKSEIEEVLKVIEREKAEDEENVRRVMSSSDDHSIGDRGGEPDEDREVCDDEDDEGRSSSRISKKPKRKKGSNGNPLTNTQER